MTRILDYFPGNKTIAVLYQFIIMKTLGLDKMHESPYIFISLIWAAATNMLSIIKIISPAAFYCLLFANGSSAFPCGQLDCTQFVLAVCTLPGTIIADCTLRLLQITIWLHKSGLTPVGFLSLKGALKHILGVTEICTFVRWRVQQDLHHMQVFCVNCKDHSFTYKIITHFFCFWIAAVITHIYAFLIALPCTSGKGTCLLRVCGFCLRQHIFWLAMHATCLCSIVFVQVRLLFLTILSQSSLQDTGTACQNTCVSCLSTTIVYAVPCCEGLHPTLGRQAECLTQQWKLVRFVITDFLVLQPSFLIQEQKHNFAVSGWKSREQDVTATWHQTSHQGEASVAKMHWLHSFQQAKILTCLWTMLCYWSLWKKLSSDSICRT